MAQGNDKSTLAIEEYPPLTYNHTPSSIAALIKHITSTSPSIAHSILPEELSPKSSTNHSHALPSQIPKAIFYPSSTEDTSIILKACHERRVAATAYSGGTSLPGSLTNSRGGIAMSCSGTNAYRYGTMKEWVISLTAVLADGTVLKTRNRPRKSSAGYDLTHLIIGSEGTLALVTEAVLKVTPLPQNLHVGKATFPSMQAGVDTAINILRSGHLLEAIELADEQAIKSINHSKLAKEYLEEMPTLFLKFAGSKETVSSQIDFVKKVCKQNGGLDFEASDDKDRIAIIWGARKCIGNALVTMKRHPSDIFINTDAAVPISAMASLVEQTNRIIASQSPDWFCASVGHVGDGNVHTAIVCPAGDKAKAEQVLVDVQRLALRLEGTITGEHGVGLKLREMLVEEVGEVGVGVMRRVKASLDPRGILNPDKVVQLEIENVGRLEKL
ncbi:D-lactate ferricytochrome c oxidoreductase [Kalmusia sp. IMI 367209]|nr:D-lactate ferricytochrome c oxidoreductase [Kalmusia sp. IMI 367209]